MIFIYTNEYILYKKMDIWLTTYHALQFLIKLRFPNGTPVSIIIVKMIELLIKTFMIITVKIMQFKRYGTGSK